MVAINIKRIYEEAKQADGRRVLVDKLWPRGISKQRAQLDLWAKKLAPSNSLRKWYHQQEGNWQEFCSRYFAELDTQAEAMSELLALVKKGKVTLLFSSKELKLNNAVALKEYVISRCYPQGET